MQDLSSAVAVVTGASRGVGRGIALELGAAGATVYVTGRSVDASDAPDELSGTVTGTADAVTDAGGDGIAVACDHTDDAAVAALAERIDDEHGRVDVLVNNVWGGYEEYDETFDAPFWEQPVERWDAMFDVGVRAHFTTTRALASLLFAADDALVVTISSGDGDRYRGNVPYDVAKTADDRLGKAMAYELRGRGIASVVLHPGFTRTERVVAAFESTGEAVPETAHSPAFVGRAVVALATDPDVFDRSGDVRRVGELAREYDFADVDGTQPEPFDLDTPEL
ncbi:SDR family NAD(P)-dependent oxidoreductase [Halorubellus litoreus]|uniref:SDR family NAD(P)-dependent oxidoreductase n=1 Tax=Halorubellus litoreus TaxID=755308 RepID=A0ABD5VNL0_9EURY